MPCILELVQQYIKNTTSDAEAVELKPKKLSYWQGGNGVKVDPNSHSSVLVHCHYLSPLPFFAGDPLSALGALRRK